MLRLAVGLLVIQTYMYYMHYSEDSSAIKVIVAATWILDTLHVSFMCHMLYYYLITNYGNLMSLEYIVWFVHPPFQTSFPLRRYGRSFPASLLVNLLVVIVVQSFFAHRIYYLCRPQMKWFVTAPIILLILVHLGEFFL
ncbi:hypothetical protein F5J12DRAFT_97305 [Pisolithus orientalis]|uniref:uncharacterized protein n=1 Tax=Pisolithus orientalis TaxID=936130 RepID=UPI002225268E|nr:uncharacterized protein F5J12DRAFT_97305 [Pisolithus orientalis]KAI6006511.1 hypothetical protein F5J12DRAFT_97305 [Pisolithus orientalis]